MAKKRVYEVAKELGLESKQLIAFLSRLGIEVKNHMSTLENDEIEKVQKATAGTKEQPKDRNRDKEKGKIPEQRAKHQRQSAQEAKGQKRSEREGQNHQGRSQGQRPQGERSQGQRPQGDRPQGQRPQGQRPQGQRPQGQKPQGQRPQGDRPQGQKPQGQRPQGQRPQGQKPQGQRPQGDRPQGQRPQGQRPQGQRPQGQRPQGQRPQDQLPQGKNQGEGPNKGAARKERSKDWDRKRKNKERFSNNNTSHKHGKGKKGKGAEKVIGTVPPKQVKPIDIIGDSIMVKDLAIKMNKSAADLIKKLIGMGVMVSINQEIDIDTASIIAGEFGLEINKIVDEAEYDFIQEVEDDPKDLVLRPSVVTVMGHVDHGKTSLLDAIREANVTEHEAGGITQHIGAYQVTHEGKKITFLDTPGHEAFTAMRARGAQVTDIAVLVVAADDGVMPQTIEAINHSKAAEVPIIIAINKMDKAGANPDRVKQELTEHGLVPEEWGGDTICVPVSAKTREGLDNLLEMILLVSEIQEFKANPKRLANGTVVEAELDKGRGPVATVLVQGGTLHIGDAIVAGSAAGKVRAMVDHKGRRVKKAGPSTPVEVLGLSDVPAAGDVFNCVEDEKKAKEIAEKRVNKKKEEEMKASAKVSLDDLFNQIQEGHVKELNIIIKADVQGSIEALKQSLAKLSTDEVRVNPIHGGVGAIKETDIMLAAASNAIIIGFNVRPDANARKAAEAEKVDIRLYTVIYNAIEDVKKAMAGLLDPEFTEVVIGRVEVRTTFKVSKVGTIAGCYVTEGKVTNHSKIRLIRDGIVIHEGTIDSLKRFKDDTKEVVEGYECGITIEKYNDIQEGDIVEAYVMEEVKREL